jgi:tetratricopeptide (TPR) repeat protein
MTGFRMGLAGIALLVSALSTSTAIAGPADEFMTQGRAALAAGTPYGALKATWAFREAIKADAQRLEAYQALADAAARFHALHPGEPKWLLVAFAALEGGLERYPDRPEIHTAFGKLYETVGMPAMAVAAYGRALDLNPGDARLQAALRRAKTARQPDTPQPRWWEVRPTAQTQPPAPSQPPASPPPQPPSQPTWGTLGGGGFTAPQPAPQPPSQPSSGGWSTIQ